MEEMIGHVTAISELTRESGNIVGNSLKSIYARIQTNSSATGALEAIGIALNNIDGTAKSSSELLAEVANKWDGLSDAQRRSTAVGVAGIYQLSRFNALMLNWDQSISATTTALESQGSAMNEQEKYNKSLEARINRLNTAWFNLSNTVGETILSDAIVVATDLMTKFTDTGEQGAKSLSVLPPVLGILGVGLVAISTRFRGLVTSVGTSTVALAKSATTMGTASMSAQGLAFSLLRLQTAMRGLFMATAVGAVFVGLGIAIEKLTKAYSDNAKAQEGFELRQSKNISALTEYKDRTYELIDTYKRLTEAQQNGSKWDVNKEQEYLDVQRELGELFPSLVESISANGEVRLKSIDAIEQEVGVTKELIQAKKDLEVAQAKNTFKDDLDEINKLKNELKDVNAELEEFGSIKTSKRGLEIVDEDKLDGLLGKLEYEMTEIEVKIFETSQKMSGSILKISDAFSTLDLPPSIAKSIDNIVASLDFEGMNPDELVSFAKELAKLQDVLAESSKSGDQVTYDKTVASLDKLFKSTNNYRSKLTESIPTLKEYIKTLSKAEQSTRLMSEVSLQSEGGFVDYTDKITDMTSAMSDYKDIAEQMAGVSQSTLDNSDELLNTYKLLSDRITGYNDEQLNAIMIGKNLTSEEQRVKVVMEQRLTVIKALQALYPQLANLQIHQINLSREQIKAIEEENNANRILHQSYQNVYSGKYTAEQRMTLASVEGTKARIANLNAEIKALSLMVSSYETMYKGFIGKGGTSDPEVARFLAREAEEAKKATARIKELSASVSGLQSGLSTAYKKLDSFNSAIANPSKGSSSSTGSSSTSEKDLANYIYQANVYAEAIEQINRHLDHQSDYRNTLIEGSDQYIASLKHEKTLEADKLKYMTLQLDNLQAQIRAGKIIEYGRVDTNAESDRAEQLAQLAKAKAEAEQLYFDIYEQTEAIREIEHKIFTATSKSYADKQAYDDRQIELSRAKLANYEKTSREYLHTMEYIIGALADKQRWNRSELDFLNGMIASGNLQQKTIVEVTQRIEELRIEMEKLATEIKDANYEVIIDIKTHYDDYKSGVEFEIDKINKLMARQTRGSDEWNASQEEKIRLQRIEAGLIKEQINKMQEEIAKRDLSIDKISELNREIRALTLTYYDAINAEQELAKELASTQDEVANDMADKLWSAYQSYLKERRDETKKALDEESKLEAKKHKDNMDRLKSELDLFKKQIDERKKLLDKQEADRDFSMDMDDILNERRDISSQLDSLALDNSREAGKRRRELQNQLDKIDKDIAEKQHDREVSLQKDALDELLKSREETIAEEQRIQDELYDVVSDRIDKEKAYWEKHYTDLENDERKYAKLREDIMNKSWGTIANEFQGYIGEMVDTLPMLADSLDGTMEEVGMNIRRNVIDALREAIEVMNEFANKQTILSASTANSSGLYNPGASGSAGSFGTRTTSSSTLTASDMKVLLGKYLWENVAEGAVDNYTKENLQIRGHALANEGRKSGSNISDGVQLNEYLSRMTKNDLEQLSKFITTNPVFNDDPNIEQYLRDFAKRLMLASARLSSGGMIPSSSASGLDGIGGRSIIVHPNEIISNPIDSKNLLEMNDNMISAFGIIKPLVDKINNFTPASMSTGLDGGLNVIFQVEHMNATQAEAEQFGNTIGEIMTRRFGRG